MGNMTKITVLINFGQKYTKNELNDPLVAGSCYGNLRTYEIFHHLLLPVSKFDV